jgi:hypothetical protein
MVKRTRACVGSSVEAVDGISGIPAASVRVKVIVTMPCASTVAAVISDTRPAPGGLGGIVMGVVVLVVVLTGVVVCVGPPPTVVGTQVSL